MKHNHYVTMIIIMILSGLLSTMNMWVDQIDHVRLSINDIYMISLMTGWMIFFMGVFYKEAFGILSGILLVLFSVICIRTQFLVSESQFLTGMIPHHSMAIHMSRKLLESTTLHPEVQKLAESILQTQQKEIQQMKTLFITS